MKCRIEPLQGTSEEIVELSDFLATFVSEGGLRRPRPVDRHRETWEKRLAGWWTENPYCGPDSPKGFALRNEEGCVVGLFGFIPHDFVYEGRILPALISTTFYVREANRDAALGLFLRANRLRGTHQIVDGDPNAPVAALLERTGYSRGPAPTFLFYPARRRGWRPMAWLKRVASLPMPSRSPLIRTGRIVTDAALIESVPTAPSDKLRKHCNQDTLVWYQNSGTRRKYFVGWCDPHGILRCYLLGIPWQKLGREALMIIQYAAFDDAAEALLDDLVLHVASHPEESGLPPETDLLIWPVLEERAKRSPFRMHRDNIKVYYHVPPDLRDAPRIGRAFDGDNIFY